MCCILGRRDAKNRDLNPWEPSLWKKEREDALLPSTFPSIRVFSNESVLHIRWPKYWGFSISPSNEHPGLISFRMDWLYLLAVPGTLKSLLQHHSSKASILRRLAFFSCEIVISDFISLNFLTSFM